jgi:hypothetical protein
MRMLDSLLLVCAKPAAEANVVVWNESVPKMAEKSAACPGFILPGGAAMLKSTNLGTRLSTKFCLEWSGAA